MTEAEYMEMATMAIKRYLNSSADSTTIEGLYGLAIKRLASKAKALDGVKTTGVTSYSEGNQSMSFNDLEAFAITSDIAILLPNKKSFYAW